MTMNENIKTLRLQKRLSQEALGELLGVSAQAVSKWEQGITSPDISLLPALAECFGVTIDSLFQGVPKRKYPGYGTERMELYAIYEDENGTDEDFRRAEEAYREVIMTGKANIQDYLDYAALHRIRMYKDRELAMRYYRRALEEGKEQRGDSWFAAHRDLVQYLIALGRTEDAIAESRKWCEEEPNARWTHVYHAQALEGAGRLEEAWKEIEIALTVPDEELGVEWVSTDAGDLCAMLGRYEEAISYWDKVPKDSTSISHLFSKAEMYVTMGEKEKAIKQFEEILVWLEEHGYNMELESVYPLQRIEQIKNL